MTVLPQSIVDDGRQAQDSKMLSPSSPRVKG